MSPDNPEDAVLTEILLILSDGQVHSGQHMAGRLGVSRTAVWKQLQKLQAKGVTLESVKGKGYRIAGGLELLDRMAILSRISPDSRALLSRLDIFGSLPSTNDQVLRAISTTGPGYVCLAEQQTAGRGRRGRQWVSPFGKNIYLSVGWEYEGGAAVLEGLSLAVGVAIVRALQASGIAGVQLKWPNDVLWCGKKLAGVLLEMSGDASGKCQVVIGIGINVDLSEEAAGEITQEWVDLRHIESVNTDMEAAGVTRNQLAALLVDELFLLLKTYSLRRFAFYKSAWESLNAFADQEVDVHLANEIIKGKMLGVTEAGALKIDCGGHEKTYYGGEISLRGRAHVT